MCACVVLLELGAEGAGRNLGKIIDGDSGVCGPTHIATCYPYSSRVKNRFTDWSKTKIANAAAAEAEVSFKICYAVLFQGKAIKSNATRHVLRWAQREGYRITTPAKGRRVEDNTSADNSVGPGTAAALDAAERAIADLSK